MPLSLFEGLSLLVICFALGAMGRSAAGGWRALLAEYAALAVAAWLGEASCIALYRSYGYATGWHLRVAAVPLLVPLIWPLVVLSARQAVTALWPRLALAGGLSFALAVGGLVVVDASLVEVLAVRAGLWSWAEGGHLGVPIIGILGWGYFAVGATLALGLRTPLRYLLLVPLAPAVTHGLIVASWWGLFRWTARGDLGAGSLAVVAALGGLGVWVAAGRRRSGQLLPLSVAVPRIVAAGLFLALLLTNAPTDGRLWLHTAAVALPYCLATRWR